MGGGGRISEGSSQEILEGLPDTSQHARGVRRQWIAGIIASLGMWTTGSAIGWSSPSVPRIEDGEGISGLTRNELSWVASLIMLAALPGCYLGGYIADRIGRRMLCMLAVFPFVLGWGVVAAAQNAWMLIVGRIIVGVSSGTYTVSSAVFCAEIAEDKLRSRLISWNVVALCLGILYTYIIGAVVGWRLNTIISGVTPLVQLLGMMFLWETPRYLITKGKLEKASKSLQWYRGARTEADTQLEFEKLVSDVNEANTNNTDSNQLSTPNEKIWVASTIKPVLISVSCAVFQQLSGTSAVTFYTVEIFDSAGSSIEPNVSAILVGGVQAAGTAFAGLLMTKFGRRPLFIFSEIGMGCSLAVLGVFYYLKENEPDKISNLGWLPLASLIAYMITYCSGAGILPWTMMADLCPPHVKGIASAICTSANCGLGFLVGLVFPRLLDSIKGYGAFWLFSGICAVGAVFMALFLPETKDKTMDEIMNLFKKKDKDNSSNSA